MREGCDGGGRAQDVPLAPRGWDPSPKSHLPEAQRLRSTRAQRQTRRLPLAQAGPDLSPKCRFPSPEPPQKCRRASGDPKLPPGGVRGRIAAGTAGAVLPVRVARCLGWPRAGGHGCRPGGSWGVQAAGTGVDGPRVPAWCWISGHRPERGHQRVMGVTVPRVPVAAGRARTCSKS